jgi:hypothetical protein
MSDRRATRQLNSEAVKAANAAIAKETGGRPLTMGPEDTALRKKWMDAYIAAGGGYETVGPTGKKSGEVVEPCDPKSCIPPACRSATIKKPRGSQSSSSNPTSSWLTTPCFHFDFQGVIGGTPGSYVLGIEGEVEPAPPYTCQWDLEATAGLLTNATSPAPRHTEPNAAGEGVLKLTGMNGATAGSCEAQKRIKVYQDHLARDRDNFGVGISCGANGSASWRFTHLGATIDMPTPWNCHGGTLHIHNGSGTGNEGPGGVGLLLDPVRLKKTVQVTHTPTGAMALS